jgi:hypothetical protein
MTINSIELILDLYVDGASNDRYKTKIPETCKYLSGGDIIAFEYEELEISFKRFHVQSGHLFLFVNYDVDPMSGLSEAKDRFERLGFIKS